MTKASKTMINSSGLSTDSETRPMRVRGYTVSAENGKNGGEMNVWCYAER